VLTATTLEEFEGFNGPRTASRKEGKGKGERGETTFIMHLFQSFYETLIKEKERLIHNLFMRLRMVEWGEKKKRKGGKKERRNEDDPKSFERDVVTIQTGVLTVSEEHERKRGRRKKKKKRGGGGALDFSSALAKKN